MKILLAAVNAKYIHSNPAIYGLRAYAVRRCPELDGRIELAEYTINHDLSTILADLYQRRPDVLGFSCYIWNMEIIRELVREIHKLYPRLPIWLGGPEVSYEPQSVIRTLPMIAGIMLGEGEETFLELARYYVRLHRECAADAGVCSEAGRAKESFAVSSPELREIAGLYLPDGGATAARELTDMSEMPFYYEDLKPFENRIIYYESSRGCPFRCSYCLSSIDKRVRFRDADKVCRELQFFLDHRVPQVKFTDRTFNCNKEHALRIWRYIKEHDNGVTNFHFEIEADLLSGEELTLLRSFRPGLAQMEIGVQSTNPRTLREIRRTVDTERLRTAVAALKSGHNIHVHLDLIAGLPYEDYECFGKSFDEVYAMRPQQLQLGFLKVLKGSHMYEMREEYGMAYLSKPPYEVLYTEWLSFEEVTRLKKIEQMLELYYNSNQFTRTLPALEKLFSSPFAMYEALARFYEERGYFANSPSRTYRYEVLLEFARLYDAQNAEYYRELLTYDMYLRENLKARAGFMRDISASDGLVRGFYEHEEKEPNLLKDYAGHPAKQLRKMTHMEPFFYMFSQKETYVLFDYRVRDPLTGNVKTVVIAGDAESAAAECAAPTEKSEDAAGRSAAVSDAQR